MKKVFKLSNIISKLDPELAASLKEAVEAENLKVEDVDVYRKNWPTEEKAALEEGSRSAIKYVSTRSLDQVGDIVVPKGIILNQYKKTGMPVFWNHNYSLPPIGSDEWIKADDWGIKAKTIYGDTGDGTLANIVWSLVQQGHQKQSSVGLIPIETIRKGDDNFKDAIKALSQEWPEFNKDKKSVNRIITKAILFEHSDVALGCNTDTEVLAVSKMFKDAGADEKLLKQLGLPLMNIEEETEEKVEKSEEIVKSPACRQEGESKEECMKRKIPEIVEEGKEQDQAVAIASSLCDKPCSEKSAGFQELVEEEKAEKQEKFNCQCIKCGYKMTSEQHCNELTCPKCGGQMRREERPGPGQPKSAEKSKVTLVKEPQTVKLIQKPVISQEELNDMVKKEIRKKLGRLI